MKQTLDFQNPEVIPNTVGRVRLPKKKLWVMSAIKDGVALSCKHKGRARIWNMLLDDKEKKPGSWTKIVWLVVCMYVGGCACKGSRLLPGILLEY